MPISVKFVSRVESKETVFPPSRFLKAVEAEFEETPLFLGRALSEILGLRNLSVRDLFWAGATNHITHPYLKGTTFLSVNRKKKTPAPSLSLPVWAQPVYLLEARDGKQMFAVCCLQNGTLVIRPRTTRSAELLRLRNRDDVEVLGMVVAVARRLRSRVTRK